MADTTAPRFKGYSRSPSIPGPSMAVSVGARVIDASNVSVNVSYGYDNSTWSTVNLAQRGNVSTEYTGRNPTSGYSRGTLQGTYDPGINLTYLNVYIYSSDSDTCWVRVRGYKEATSTWENLYYSTNTGSGTKVNRDLDGDGYTRWDIRFYDSEGNDNCYYNYTYRAGVFVFNGTIPAAGSNSKVYYFFNATDNASNTRLSPVFNYTVDNIKPQIDDFTKPSSPQRVSMGIPIYANASDASGLREVHLNWSVTGASGHSTRTMSRVSGTAKDGEYMARVPAPSKNTTVSIWVGAYDEGGNYNNTSKHNFTYDPPPRIENVTVDPAHPNGTSSVNISADVYDDGTVKNVTVKYSTDNSTWKVMATNSSGSRYWSLLPANTGSPWVYWYVYANDSSGGTNETPVSRFYVDKTKPRIHTPYTSPDYPNASAAVWAIANVTDFVGLRTVKVLYSMDGGSTWNSTNMTKASDLTNLTVAGYVRTSSSSYYQGLADIGDLLGTWNSSLGGYGGTPSSALFTDVDVILLDGSGGSFYYNQAITAARAGKYVVVNYNTWNSVRSVLSYPTYTTHVSYGFTSYGLTLGRGAVVMTYSLTNRAYMGYSYDGYNSTTQAALAAHLKGAHLVYMPYSGQIPASGSSVKVLYKINATDLSGLTTETNNYEYTTDGTAPTFHAVAKPTSGTGWDQSKVFPVWANVSDDNPNMGSVVVYYSFNSGSTWSTVTLSKASGNATHGNWTGNIPAPGTSTWVQYYYVATDRAGNTARRPASTVYSYQTSDAPVISGISHSPTVGNAVNPVTVTATVRDPDVVSLVRVVYRYGTSGNWTTMNATAGTNDRWSGAVPSPGQSTRVYYYLEAKDSIGVWATSGTYSYTVDGEPPKVTVGGYSPQYVSSSTAVTVNGTASDSGGFTAQVQYKRGASGTVTNIGPTFVGATKTDRNPASGTTYSSLSRTYYLTAPLTYLNVYVYSSDHDTLTVRVRGYKNSTSNWEDIYYATRTRDGTKVNRHWTNSGYGAFSVYVRDTEGNDRIYYNITYKYGSDQLYAQIPATGFSTWVYYRVTASDSAGNVNTTEWKRYWSDGSSPTLTSHAPPGVMRAESPVTITATFQDEYAINRSVIHYSYGGSYQTVSMSSTTVNTTHLTAAGAIPASMIPMTVTYYFGIYDRAGNYGQTGTYTYTTSMGPLAEGVSRTYDAGNLYTAVGYKTYQWDFDYDGTFNQDKTGRSVSHAFMDNGTYTIALRLTDNNDVVTMMTFNQTVTDVGPTARIAAAGASEEGNTIDLNGSISISFPDSIVKYEWDLDYDGTSFDADVTNMVANITYMDNGTYTVALRVTDDDGSVHVANRTFEIRDLNPKITFTGPTYFDEGEQVTFNATETTSWPDALVKIEWDLDYSGSFDVDAVGNVTTHVYMDDGTYSVRIRVHDEDSYSERTIGIEVNDLRPTAVIIAPDSVDEGETVLLVGSNSTSYPDDIIRWEWDLDRQGTFTVDATTVNVSHTYMDHGNYTVALRVRDDDGSAHVTTFVIRVLDLAPVAVIVAPTSVDEGETFSLNASNSTSFPDTILSYEWDLNYDGLTFAPDIAAMALEHTYDDHGNYTIALRVTDDDMSTTLTTVVVVVNDLAPFAGLSFIGHTEEGEELSFSSDTSASWPDALVKWEWDMDYDGDAFNPVYLSRSAKHTYMDDGTYVVALRLTDDDGSTTIGTLELTIQDRAPTARMLREGTVPGVMQEGDSYTFDAASNSYSFPDEIVAFEWSWEADAKFSFGEGNGTMAVTFLSPGDHTFWLLVRDDDGTESVTNITIRVTDVGPNAILTAETTPEGEPMVLNASATTEPGMDLMTFKWDIDGDGVWDEETMVPSYEWTYYAPGLYDVRMQVVDEDGSTDSVSIKVTVTDVGPVADAGGPYQVHEGETLLLDASASSEPGDHIDEYAWDLLDDGQYSIQRTGPQVEWSWNVAGTYEVTLYVTDADGSEDMVKVSVMVDDLEPTFNISMPEDVREDEEVTYEITDLSDPGTVEFQVRWYFGNGNTAEGLIVTNTFVEDGIYRGNITILDNDGTLYRYELDDVIVANVPPSFTMDITRYVITEDEPFTLQLTAEDTSVDTISFDFEGPGGTLDPVTGIFKWTPLDGDVGPNEFTFKAIDEDGGSSEMVVTLDVDDVDNDFIGGMSTAGGSALILLLIIAVLLVAVLYMRYRGGKGLGGDDEDEEDETVVILPQRTAPEEPTTVPDAEPATVPGPAPTTAPAAATGEATSGDADQIPPPPTPPAGPQFNQVLEDRANESELETDEETEPGHESEWEVID